MRIAIAGSSGFIGSALSERLRLDGHDVTGLRRGSASDPAAHWDPERGWFREGALEGVDAVLNMTGVSIGAKRWTDERLALLRSSRVDAVRVLVDHLSKLTARPRTLISASAVGYYGDRGDEVLTEQSTRGAGLLADLVADWEQEAQGAGDFGMRVVTARFGPVLSAGSELLDRLLPPFRLGVGGRIGSGRQWFSWVTLHDLVEAVRFALEHESISGPVNVCAPNPVRNSDFTGALGRELRRPTLFPLPAPMLRLAFGEGRTNETLLVSQRAVPERLSRAGFVFAYPTIESALREILHGNGATGRPAA